LEGAGVWNKVALIRSYQFLILHKNY